MWDSEDITNWIERVKAGDAEAAQQLWKRYVGRLVSLAHQKLPGRVRRYSDGDDVVQSVFHSFFVRAQDGRFPELQDRDDLWSLLVVITHRKAANETNRDRTAKRGGGLVRGESILGNQESNDSLRGLNEVLGTEPTPDFALEVAESFDDLLASLGSDEQRQVACLKMEGFTVDEIATKLGMSSRSVARKLALARERLEERLT